jgi:hypothetical protein
VCMLPFAELLTPIHVSLVRRKLSSLSNVALQNEH